MHEGGAEASLGEGQGEGETWDVPVLRARARQAVNTLTRTSEADFTSLAPCPPCQLEANCQLAVRAWRAPIYVGGCAASFRCIIN